MQLDKEGYPCTSISGELEHAKRDKVISEFRTGITKVLIATDVLARGFDVQQVSAYVWLAVSYCLQNFYNLNLGFTCNCNAPLLQQLQPEAFKLQNGNSTENPHNWLQFDAVLPTWSVPLWVIACLRQTLIR